MKLRTLLPVLLLTTGLSAQKYFHRTSDQPLSFTELQRQFADWSHTVNLPSEHHWKYYKRWEADMLMHTNAQGERTDPAGYIRAAVDAAASKNANTSSRMASSAWYPVGPNYIPGNQTGYMENGIGRINCIAFHPTNGSTYCVGVAQGGVWKTTNNGATWTPLTDNLPILRISDIAIDPNDPDSTMYISVCDFEYIGFGLYLNGRKRNTHYGLGVYKTTDGGQTWQPTGLTFLMTDGDASLIRRILIDPNNSNNLLACGVSGMYRSTDAGASWTSVNSGLFWDMQRDPATPNTVYAATGWVMTANDGAAGIWKSTDFGQTWTQLPTGIPPTGSVQRVRLAVAPSDPNYVYAIAVDVYSGLYGIYKSTNAGASWSYTNPGVNILEWDDGTGSGGQGTYDLGFMVHPSNRDMLYVGGINIWGSSDGGQTWDPASHWTLFYGPTLHGDIHFIERNPVTGNIFVCSDGGIYRTTNILTQTWSDATNGFPWPTQWTNIGNGLAITSFYRLSSSRNAAGRLVAGAQDNGTFYYDNGTWNTIFGGDGMDNYLDPVDNDMIICSSQYGNFGLYYDDGFSNTGTSPNVNFEPAEWTSPIIADYNNYGTLYAGFLNVVKSVDDGVSWTVISNFPNDSTEVSALAVSNTNSNVLYAAKRVRYELNHPGKLYKTTNGGGSWSNITAGLPDSLYFTGVEISESDANTAYVTMAGFSGGNKVFRTTDGGATWQNISYNLPNIPVNCVKYIPAAGTVMIATDLGVYVLDAVNSTWINQSTGLPNVIVSDIEFNFTLNKIYVSTFGRGIWATDLDVFTANISTPAAASLSLSLFPSPNDGAFTITVPESSAAETFDLEIIDISGRVVHSEKLSGQTAYAIRFGAPSGMYFAHVRGKTLSGVKSFVVE